MINYFILKYYFKNDLQFKYYLKIIEKKNVLNELYYNLAQIPSFNDIINYIKLSYDNLIYPILLKRNDKINNNNLSYIKINNNYQLNYLIDKNDGKLLFSNENDIEYYIKNLKKNISKIDNNMILYDIKSKNIYLITDENVYSRINI